MSAQNVELLWTVSLQAGLLALVVWVISRLAKNAPARLRHALWVVVLIKFLIPPFAYLPAELAFWQQTESVERTAALKATVPPPASLPMASDTDASEAPAGEAVPVGDIAPLAGFDYRAMIVLCWMAGASAFLVLLVRRLRRQSRLLRDCRPAGEAIEAMLVEAAQELKIRRLPGIGVSESAPTAMLISLLRPTILLPSNIVTECDIEKIRAILLHELAHLKRRDLAVMWLHQLVQVLFFFHPAVWLAGRELKQEREIACDELVLSAADIEPEDYASGYLAALKLANGMATVPASLAMAEPFDVEKRRLVSMLNPARGLKKVWLLLLAAVVVVGLPTFAGVAAHLGAQERSAKLDVVVREADAAELVKEVLRRLGAAESSLNQMDASFQIIERDVDLNSDNLDLGRRVTRWAFKDEKVRYERRVTDHFGNPKRLETEFLGAYDGSRSYYYYPSIGRGRIVSAAFEEEKRIKERWFILDIDGSRDQPLSQYLASNQLEYGGLENIDGNLCHKLMFTEPYGPSNLNEKLERTVWISPDHGWRAKRIRIAHTVSGRLVNYRIAEVAEFVRYAKGKWLPLKGSQIDYRVDSEGNERFWHSARWRVTKWDPSVPDEVFRLAFPDGTRLDRVFGTPPPAVVR